MEFLSHIYLQPGGHIIRQTVAEHSRNAAAIAGKCLESVGLSPAGYLAGLMHDAGKCKKEFQDYLLDGNGRRGSVNHTFAGCRMILEQFHSNQAGSPTDATAELLAFAVGAHHGQFDCVDAHGQSGFLHRLEKEQIGYAESRAGFYQHCAKPSELTHLFECADEALSPVYEKLQTLISEERPEEFPYYLGVLARLLASAVMEGDRQDTAAFMGGHSKAELPQDLVAFWTPYLQKVEKQLQSFPQETAIQKARSVISHQCRTFAENEGGIYRLNVPTGAGKTISSLRYALAHAARWKKERVVFVSPLLSILEQNAQVIRDMIEDDSIILEHHSNVVTDALPEEALDLRELAIESWEHPIIITTMVQFLNTLFLGKTTSIRRFHSLSNAVVVVDEVQTVPNNMLSLFNLTLNFLSAVCHTTFLLCSATQPSLEKAAHPLRCSKEAVVPYDYDLFAPFHRTKLTDAGSMPLEAIPDLARNILLNSHSLLIICNKRQQASYLYRQLSAADLTCFHLSASMCVAHRRETLSAIQSALSHPKGKIICISTQVMEAGVDLSFQRVIRLSAGLDRVVQAAGRCNRNGEEVGLAPVYLVSCANETLGRLPQIQQGKTVTTALLNLFHQDPARFGDDLASEKAIGWYYQHLYQNLESSSSGYQDFTVPSERNTLFSMLSSNDKYYDFDCPFYGRFFLNQAFQLAGASFRVLEDTSDGVLVPYGEGKQLIGEMDALPDRPSLALLQSIHQRAKPYMVALYDYQKKQLANFLTCIQGIWILDPAAYDATLGLVIPEETLSFLEV